MDISLTEDTKVITFNDFMSFNDLKYQLREFIVRHIESSNTSYDNDDITAHTGVSSDTINAIHCNFTKEFTIDDLIKIGKFFKLEFRFNAQVVLMLTEQLLKDHASGNRPAGDYL